MQKFTVLPLPNLMKVAKASAYLLAALCGIGVVFLVLLLLINLPVFDEDLHPDLAAVPAEATLPPVAGNAYYALVGFRADTDRNFIAAGRALMQRYVDNRAAGSDQLTNEDYDEILGTESLSGLLAGADCNPLEPDCGLEQLGATLRQGGFDRSKMDLLLQRYDALLALPRLQYLDAATIGTPAPDYEVTRDAQKYKLAERYNSGSSTAFLEQVAADLAFWKRVLRDGQWLVDKMVAVAALWVDMQLLSEYLATHELSADDRALVASFLVPLSSDELDIGEAFRIEAQSLHASLEYLHAHPERVGALVRSRFQLQLTLPNATANRQYLNLMQPLMELNRLPAADYARTVAAPGFQVAPSMEAEPRLSPASLYNPGGKLLLPRRWRGAHLYIGRVHDIDTMLRAVRLQFELAGLLPEIRGGAMRTLAEELAAYAGVAVTYDESTGMLAFACNYAPLRNDSLCRVQL